MPRPEKLAHKIAAALCVAIASPAMAQSVDIHKHLKSSSHPGLYSYAVHYATFSGSPLAVAASADAEKRAQNYITAFVKTANDEKRDAHDYIFHQQNTNVTCVVTCATPDVISYYLTKDEPGGAHDIVEFEGVTWGWKNGKATKLKLADLFLPGVSARSSISPIVISRLKSKGAAFVLNGQVTRIDGPSDDWEWSVTPTGIDVLLTPGWVNNEATGPYVVPAAFVKLSSKLAVDGPAGSVIKPALGL